MQPTLAEETEGDSDGETVPPSDGADVAPEEEAEEAAADSDGDVREEELVDPVPGSGFDREETVDDSDDGPDLDDSPFDHEDDAFGPGVEDEEEEESDEKKTFEEPINAGFARLSVVGLPEETEDEKDEKERLRKEFREVFEEFQLGYYGNEVMHEYVLHGDDDIDPIWGFLGAMVICSGLVIHQRPDGDQVLQNATDRLPDLRN